MTTIRHYRRSIQRDCWRAPPCSAPRRTPARAVELERLSWLPLPAFFTAFELEGDLQLRTVRRHLAVLHLHVELDDLGDAQIAQRLGSPAHGDCGRLLP